jgi:hypothetical protein
MENGWSYFYSTLSVFANFETNAVISSKNYSSPFSIRMPKSLYLPVEKDTEMF